MNPADAPEPTGPEQATRSDVDGAVPAPDVPLSNLPWAITQSQDDRSLPPWFRRAVILILILAAAAYPPDTRAPALLQNRPLIDDRPTAYLCEGFVCRQPVTEPEQLISLF